MLTTGSKPVLSSQWQPVTRERPGSHLSDDAICSSKGGHHQPTLDRNCPSAPVHGDSAAAYNNDLGPQMSRCLLAGPTVASHYKAS